MAQPLLFLFCFYLEREAKADVWEKQLFLQSVCVTKVERRIHAHPQLKAIVSREAIAYVTKHVVAKRVARMAVKTQNGLRPMAMAPTHENTFHAHCTSPDSHQTQAQASDACCQASSSLPLEPNRHAASCRRRQKSCHYRNIPTTSPHGSPMANRL